MKNVDVPDKKISAPRKTVADKVVDALTSKAVLDKIIPEISIRISEIIEKSITKTLETQVKLCVQEQLKPMVKQINEQKSQIEEQRMFIDNQAKGNLEKDRSIFKLQTCATEHEKEMNIMYNRVNDLEARIENQEQYSRRTSLRFHNVKVPTDQQGRLLHPVDTDSLVLKICNEHMNLELTKEDISRSHVIGKTNNGKSQVIVRFISYRTREKVYGGKKKLKSHPDRLFITENLTEYRSNIVRALGKLKYNKKIDSYWTSDGRIYVKATTEGRKLQVQNLDDVREIEIQVSSHENHSAFTNSGQNGDGSHQYGQNFANVVFPSDEQTSGPNPIQNGD